MSGLIKFSDEIVIYKSEDGATNSMFSSLRKPFGLTQAQMESYFEEIEPLSPNI